MKDHVQYHVKDRLIHIEQEEETIKNYISLIYIKSNLLLIQVFVLLYQLIVFFY